MKENSGELDEKLLRIGEYVLRYGLVLVLLWIGFFQIHRLRSQRDYGAGCTQPVYVVGIGAFGTTYAFSRDWSNGGYYWAADCHSRFCFESVGCRQRIGDHYVSHHAIVSFHDTGSYSDGTFIPILVADAEAISAQRHPAFRHSNLDGGRSMARGTTGAKPTESLRIVHWSNKSQSDNR